MNAENLLTVDEVSRRLRLSVSTVRRYLKAGELEAVQLGAHKWGPVRISLDSLNEALRRWSTRRQERPAPTPQTPRPRPAQQPAPPPVSQPVLKPRRPASVEGWETTPISAGGQR